MVLKPSFLGEFEEHGNSKAMSTLYILKVEAFI